ncbi:MAG: N-acetylmuramoyl-L-alanine amidase [Prevotellaceae bacterium]|nr:N-acetylmuramoyl-L-alanine amidase [Prevotellaceae bacterium]
MKKIRFSLLLLAFSVSIQVVPAKDDNLRQNLRQYFENYQNPAFPNLGKIKVEDIITNTQSKQTTIVLSENFIAQPVTPLLVGDLYTEVKRLLPMPYNTYDLTIRAGKTPVEQLIPTSMMDRADTARVYKRELFKGNPWVTPMSRPYPIKKGLQGRHLSVCHSHGKYYNFDKMEWIWQRPRLFCTTEDMFTQTFVVPYLVPMLQNAGAVVFTPRERDWQKKEIIIDNDAILDGSRYEERVSTYHWQHGGIGFAHTDEGYENGHNPFRKGTFRITEATSNKRTTSDAVWIPEVLVEDDYAVYVSYQTVPGSIPDANYTVVHGGIATQFRVNQQMGGGTWVYLGTFHFTKGKSDDNCIILSNLSNYKGVVTADAVRLGGGIGNIVRGDSSMDLPIGSDMPRCLEAARYSAQWYGMPDSVYSYRGNDDGKDDVNSRPFTVNHVARGSGYLRGDSGLSVPLELYAAIHSDAGYRTDNTLIGSLGIYTTGFYEGKTATGLSRLVSRDLADMVMTQVNNDLSRELGFWSRRDLYDRNYGETRDPQVPSIIFEMLSHQNWADMRFGHDPYFKFLMSRAIYKGILRFVATTHGDKDIVVQPLPVAGVSAEANKGKNEIIVRWTPRLDPGEPTACPDGYVVYIKRNGGDFDNGHYVSGQDCVFRMEATPGVLYSFRVEAVNEGGASLPSDEVCAAVAEIVNAPSVLLVDAFQRLASPLAFDNDMTGGFDFDSDPGVIDVKSPGFCGRQISFDKSQYGKETGDGFGVSSDEFEGMILAGNTHDYSARHASDILAGHPDCNISSCTPVQLPGIDLRPYNIADFILGAQKDDGYSLTRRSAFTQEMLTAISQLSLQNTSVMVSGAFIGSDAQNAGQDAFIADKLKYRIAGCVPTDSICTVQGLNNTATIFSRPNEQNYWVRKTDIIEGIGGAFSSMVYANGGYSAAIAYPGPGYRVLAFGFPVECITEADTRRNIMNIAIDFLLGK